jgi:phosphatidylglycerol:prolipoprotein diacylglycerol transferase
LDPVLLRLGPLALRWYGLAYVLGILLGFRVGLPYAQRRGLDRDKVVSAAIPIIICGLIGGRLYYVAQNDPGYYLSHPLHILATWEGGMAFYGAIFAALIATPVVCRMRGLDTWAFLDSATLFAAAGQLVGRLGNVVNGDIVGYPSDLPWAFQYTNPASFAPRHDIAYQPAPLYEIALGLLLLGVLLWLRYRVRRPGMMLVVYLAGYSLAQFLVFFARDNVVVWAGLKQAQLTAIVVLVGCIPLIWWVSRQPPLRWAEAGDKAAAS